MKTLRNLRNILGVSLLAAIALAMSNPVQAQNQYAKLLYMGNQCHLDQNFVIGYHAIYDANVFAMCRNLEEKRDWDKINGRILDYLRNPNVTIIFSEAGQLSFAGPQPPYSGNRCDNSLNRQERKDNEKAGRLYGTVVKMAVNEWYKKNAYKNERVSQKNAGCSTCKPMLSQGRKVHREDKKLSATQSCSVGLKNRIITGKTYISVKNDKILIKKNTGK